MNSSPGFLLRIRGGVCVAAVVGLSLVVPTRATTRRLLRVTQFSNSRSQYALLSKTNNYSVPLAHWQADISEQGNIVLSSNLVSLSKHVPVYANTPTSRVVGYSNSRFSRTSIAIAKTRSSTLAFGTLLFVRVLAHSAGDSSRRRVNEMKSGGSSQSVPITKALRHVSRQPEERRMLR